MGLIKKFLEDKVRVGVAMICLLMIGLVGVASLQNESYALSADDYECKLGNEGTTIIYGSIATNKSGYYCDIKSVTKATATYKVGDSLLDDSDCAAYLNEAGYTQVTTGAGIYCTYVATEKKKSCYQCLSPNNILYWGNSAPSYGAGHECGAGWHENPNITTEAECKSTYTYTFKDEDGTVLFTKSGLSGSKIEFPTPEKGGYMFQNWLYGTSGVYNGGSSYTIEENKTFTAVWNEITITLNANGGYISSNTSVAGYSLGATSGVLTFPSASRTNHTLLGWTTTSTATIAKYKVGDTYTAKDNQTFYAVWEENGTCYKCNINANILKWKNNEDDSICSGGYYVASSTSGANCVTYTITYNANEGSGAPNAQYIAKNGVIALSSTEPTRSGYEFIGWSSHKDATSATYKAGDSFTETTHNNVTLYAVWDEQTTTEKHKVTIKFHVNGGTVTKTTQNANKTKTYTWTTSSNIVKKAVNSDASTDAWFTASNGATDVDLPNYNNSSYLEITRAGYTAKKGEEWNAKADGTGKSYNQGIDYKSSDFCDASTKDCTVTLYVNWQANKYTVSYNANGGSVSTTSKSVTYDSTYGTLATPTRTGYTFDGWYTTASGGTKVTSSSTVSITSNQTLYAHWIANTYTISYNANGGSGAPSSQTKTYGTDLTISNTKPTRTGYTFLGWNTSESATSATYTAGGKYTDNKKATLYAVWKANTYTIKYNGNGSTSGSTASSTHTYDIAKKLTTNGYAKTDYTFAGWNTKADGTGTTYTNGQLVTSLTATDGATITLYAKWTKNASDSGSDEGGTDNKEEQETITYYIKYESNGGTGTMANSTHVYGMASNLSTNTFSPSSTNATFIGWNTKADGTGDSYTDGQTISNLGTTNGEVITLYAQWNLEEIGGDDEDGDDKDNGNDNSTSGGEDADHESDKGGTAEDIPETSPQTGSLPLILVSVIGIGALVYLIYYYRRVNNKA